MIKILLTIVEVFSTIDVNIGELQYLAIHLDPYECRRLIAALHYTSYDLPKDISGAVRKVHEDIPCFQHLLHWNTSPTEGRGKTHADLVLRLRQLNRKDLADWLSKIVFQKLGKDVVRSIDKSFEELGQTDNKTQ
ncbi:uncharacterized protein [Chelonus insularis]|uniref:uncharacterized protein n=1 Tax=Chelonus insularis TaxID=460826 RepID=UPI00158AB6B8|nr:uncharacterized protein LOC118065876 [Chelonus insularis]